MAGDWIKMRSNLWDDPRIGRIVDLTNTSEAAVVGGLYWLWATADQHTEDGCLPGLSMRQIDRKTGIPGFAAALVEINWLRDDPQGVVIVSFEEHNGTSAKKRCQTAKRVANHAASNADLTQQTDEPNASSVSGALAREEKRREERKEEKKPRAAPWLTVSELEADGLPTQLAEAWIDHRRARKAKLTPLAWAGFKAEASKAGWTLPDAVSKAIARNWTAFEASWVASEPRGLPTQPQSFRERDSAVAAARVHEMTGGLVSAKKPRPDALQEVFDATPRLMG